MAEVNPINPDSGGLAQFSDGDVVAVANGGTGGTTVATAREGLRIFVSATEPASPQTDDIWIDIS